MVFSENSCSGLLIRLGWEARVAEQDSSQAGVRLPNLLETARELVDYMLFVMKHRYRRQ